MLRNLGLFVLGILAAASVFIAPMLFVMGLWAMRGMPPHISYRDGLIYGGCAVGGAVLIWLSAAACYKWLRRGEQRLRFNLRTIFIAATIVALLLGFVMSLAPSNQ